MNDRHLRAALWYAERFSYSVFPVHAPLFDHPLGYTCSCEFYRHSERCQHDHPHLYLNADQHCEQPGKCPAVRWGEKSTTDPAQIRKWWGRRWSFKVDGQYYHVEMNIGIDCGKSGILVLDRDTYKDHYVGDSILARDDEETVTSLTGGGGTHLWYRQPDGKAYGNGTGDLPAGIDIRGKGGYIVAPPSLHKSGRRYQFELDYGPLALTLRTVPEALQAVLDAAPSNNISNVGPSDIEAVRHAETIVRALLEHADLAHGGEAEWNGDGRKWALADCPFSDDHSDGAFIVIYRDGTIGAGCHHNRCQKRIQEEGGSGWQLLKEIVGFENTCDGNRGQIRAEMTLYRAWLHSAEGTEALKEMGFSRVEGPRKTLDALLTYAERVGRYTSNYGLRHWGEQTNQNHQTINNHFAVFVDAGVISINADESPWIVKIEPSPYLDTSGTSLSERVSNYGEGRAFYAAHRADDAFIMAHYAYKRRRVALVGDEGVGTLGPTALLILAYTEDHEGFNRGDLMRDLGLSYSSAEKNTRLLEEAGFLSVVEEGPRGAKVYSGAANASERLEDIRPYLSTSCVERKKDGELIGVLERRKRQNAYAQLAYAKAAPEADKERINRLAAKLDKLEGETVSPWVNAGKPRHRSRYDVHQEQERIAQLKAVYETFKDLPPAEIADKMEMAGYNPNDIALVCSGRIRFIRATDKYPVGGQRVPKEQRPVGPPPPPVEEVVAFQAWVTERTLAGLTMDSVPALAF